MVIGSRLIGAGLYRGMRQMRKARPDGLVVDQTRRAILAHQGLDALLSVTAAIREIRTDVAAAAP